MPRVYRAMRANGTVPEVSPSAVSLGVRLPPDIHADIAIGAAGFVDPRTGGMPVAPVWRLLPAHRIPRRLRARFPRAAGNNQVFLWSMGTGPFLEGPFADGLIFRPDPDRPDQHGLIEPAERMPPEDYQSRLAATREWWAIDEE